MSEYEHEHGELGHVVPFKVYLAVLLSLFILTVLTVSISQHDYGNWNLVVAMLVASAKAALVALFFMHLKYENPVTWGYAIIPVIFLLLLIAGVYIDNPYRPHP